MYLQSVPMGSPLNFKIEGDDIDNQVEVGQSAPDAYSTLTCTPECPPQEEPAEYDYEYYGGGGTTKTKNM